MISCCDNEEQTAYTFGTIFNKVQNWIIQLLNGDLQNDEDFKNITVSILFLVHVTIVFVFLAHHCSTRVNRANYF